MIDLENKSQSYYFVNREIIIVDHKNLLNLAIVRYVDSLREFVIDINFISVQPLNEKYISVSDLIGREKNDS